MIRVNGIVICRKLRLIAHGGESCRFSLYQFRLAEALLCAGPRMRTRLALFDFLYRGDPGGGPLTHVKCLDVHLHKLRRRLSGIGLTMADNGGTGGGRVYWIEPSAAERRAA